jgi:hypothetical protein
VGVAGGLEPTTPRQLTLIRMTFALALTARSNQVFRTDASDDSNTSSVNPVFRPRAASVGAAVMRPATRTRNPAAATIGLSQ